MVYVAPSLPQDARTAASNTTDSHPWYRRQGLDLIVAVVERLLCCQALVGIEREQSHQQVQDHITKPSQYATTASGTTRHQGRNDGLALLRACLAAK